MENAVNKVIIQNNYDNYNEALKDIENQGVKHLGWLNTGVEVPEHYTFEKVFSNRSGTMCLYCDTIHRVSYSVDMGD